MKIVIEITFYLISNYSRSTFKVFFVNEVDSVSVKGSDHV